jgi:hypothetical protein
MKNDKLRIELVSLCFGYVNVSGNGPLQRVAAGLSTHVFWFRHPQWLSRLNARSLLAPSFPFSPLLSSSSMFLAALTSRFQKFALRRLLVQRKTFRVHLNASFMLASFGHSTFRHRLENRLAEVISDSSNDRNYRSVWLRIEILPTHVAWRPASPSFKMYRALRCR